MSNKTPIVMQGLTRFDEKYGATSLFLAKEWAKDRMVFYIDHPFTYKDKLSSHLKHSLKVRSSILEGRNLFLQPYTDLPQFINITPNIVYPINFLSDGSLYKFLKQKNLKQIEKSVMKVLKYFGVTDFYYINSFNPVYNIISKTFEPKKTIYHCVDLISGERYIAKHGIKAEIKAVAKADQVITTSDQLKDRLSKLNSKTEVVHNGADFSHFQLDEYPYPEEYSKLGDRLKVVYVGNLGLRINYQLIKSIALKHTEIDFIFIGPINEREFEGEDLVPITNIHFLGARPSSAVPNFIYHADICMIPFVINDLTSCIYPLKINEYFSIGKPVISTEFTNLSSFQDLLYTFSDVKSFERAIHKIKQENIEKGSRRKEFAENNDWSNKARTFLEIIEND
ncbi:glycosyltransferase [Flammeovirga sp. SubArs3]|uniref:glycosyltransferase n=1 Tax=Flammeovirga sp. SubArs3 TaxID=2995316 RepID=UPI00248D170E|nr:glycosyltransferase [Flammeovirga sp. SubArs3]